MKTPRRLVTFIAASVFLLSLLSASSAHALFSYTLDTMVYDENNDDQYDIYYKAGLSGLLTWDGSYWKFPGTRPCWGYGDGASYANLSTGLVLIAPDVPYQGGFGGGCSGADRFTLAADFRDFADKESTSKIYKFGISSGNNAHPNYYQAELNAAWCTGTYNGVSTTNGLVLVPGMWLMSNDDIGEETYFVINGLDPAQDTIGLRWSVDYWKKIVTYYYRINKGAWTQFHTFTTPTGFTVSETYPGLNVGFEPNPSGSSDVPAFQVLTAFVPLLPASGAVSAGEAYSLLLEADGTLWAWGDNEFGQLGDGSLTSRQFPVEIDSGYTAIAAGGGHSLALKADGTLWTWGDNSMGQLGDGTTTSRTYPESIGGGFVDIAAGSGHSLALSADGTLRAWGYNNNGQLGDGTTNNRNTPTWIGEDFAAISTGIYHTLGLKADGTLWAWGDNRFGQLGDGSTNTCRSPIQIGSGYAAIAAGGYHSLALKTDGTLMAWGWNEFGQLGDGSTTPRYSPVQVGTEFKAISAGSGFSQGLKADGSRWAWGWNEFGQLGDGTISDQTTPHQVDTEYAAVSAGGAHVLAIMQNGTVQAWGNNEYFQLGDGTTDNAPTPVQVDPGASHNGAGPAINMLLLN